MSEGSSANPALRLNSTVVRLLRADWIRRGRYGTDPDSITYR
jgi:hypothetical protein